MMKTKIVKAWVAIRDSGNPKRNRVSYVLAVFPKEVYADIEVGGKIIPCTITYQLPSKHKKS